VLSTSQYCGRAVYTITSVDADGTVRGTFLCERTKWKPVMGGTVGPNAVKGKLTGNRFVMENMDGGGNDLIVSATTLEGSGQPNSKGQRNAAKFTKQ
jgi:hypothetical protein